MGILKSWKGCITGRFIIERHLKKGAVFISIDDNSVFLVNGIVSSWEEMLRNAPMPTLLDETLLPFKNAIISDGLVSVMPIIFGLNSKADFKEIYMDAKRNQSQNMMLQPGVICPAVWFYDAGVVRLRNN